ncbi:L,D-transpeptidase [Niabella ginsenosidivorans]|uniref:L,D-transpeptidase n=1 Tax=Niabella ginsenosidivorans TaxID=1176587 RepID=UPI001C54EF03|nr:L,D-transpeptidase [Niabella ginsenosidivorans]
MIACQQPHKKSTNTPPVAVDTAAEKLPPAQPELPRLTYSFIKKKVWQSMKDSFPGAAHLDILTAINRTDSAHIRNLDSILVPSDYSLPLTAYLPFPTEAGFLSDVHKIIVFSIPAQAFAAYENGKLVWTGQTNSGRKTKPTPPRLYFTNWKARQTISTVSDEWKLKWNFNIHNTWGIGFHEYGLPGYPASHSCMRLQEKDAKFLYYWADQWILKGNQLLACGTPVVVYGTYPFSQPRPWFRLADDPSALTISAGLLKNQVAPYIPEIIKRQQQRDSVITGI